MISFLSEPPAKRAKGPGISLPGPFLARRALQTYALAYLRFLPRASQTTMRGESLMRNEQNGHQTAVLFFAVAVVIAMFLAFLTTFERVDKRMANSEAAPGTMGLA